MNIADDLRAAYEEGYKQGKKDAVKQGMWIAGEDGHYHCSVCGHIVDKIYTCSDLSRLGYFCRNCGAEMTAMLF